MPFEPQVDDTITINGSVYGFDRLDAAGAFEFVYGQQGRKGTVYRVVAPDGSRWAFKVFFSQFQTERLLQVADQLRRYRKLPGLTVCDRQVISSDKECSKLAKHPELRYAVLMPWIAGWTWFDIIVSQLNGQPTVFSREESLYYARQMAAVLTSLEQRGLAHCDIANGNVILDNQHRRFELIDVEDMYGPQLTRPARLPAGSKGYAHPAAGDGFWSAEGDRFAGAVLLAELLGWHNPDVRALVEDDVYFTDGEEGQDCPRYQILYEVIESTFSTQLADLFAASWFSDSLDRCPRFGTWHEGLEAVTLPSAPTLFVVPDEITFGLISEPTAKTVSVTNAGGGRLQGKASAKDAPWITVQRSVFDLAAGEEHAINVKAYPEHDESARSSDEVYRLGVVQLASNGGDAELLVHARFAPPKASIVAASSMSLGQYVFRREGAFNLYLGVLAVLLIISRLSYDESMLILATLWGTLVGLILIASRVHEYRNKWPDS